MEVIAEHNLAIPMTSPFYHVLTSDGISVEGLWGFHVQLLEAHPGDADVHRLVEECRRILGKPADPDGLSFCPSGVSSLVADAIREKTWCGLHGVVSRCSGSLS